MKKQVDVTTYGGKPPKYFSNFLKERMITTDDECNIYIADVQAAWDESRKHAAIEICDILIDQIGTTTPFSDSIQAIKDKFGLEI